jgi:hypothetical protein
MLSMGLPVKPLTREKRRNERVGRLMKGHNRSRKWPLKIISP